MCPESNAALKGPEDGNGGGNERLSQKQLMWRKFKRNRLAMVGGVIVILMYTIVIFAGFFSPYDYTNKNSSYVKAPPQLIHVMDREGNLRWPFVYGLEVEIDPETWTRKYTKNHDEKHYLRFFVRGDEYKLLGLFKTDIHLFGVKEGSIFLFGADRLGRDLFSRILAGGRVSLSISVFGVFIAVVLGSFLGTVSGYFGGTVDNIIQRMIEFLRSFPRIPLWMALSASLPPSWSSIRVYFGIVIILALLGWVGLGRAVRAKIIAYREEDYVMAARSIGASDLRIILRHLMPGATSHIIVSATLRVPAMLLGEAALSFLGLGIRPPMTSWGVLLQEAQNIRNLALTPWVFSPAFFIIITILGFNFLGDGLRDAADPFSEQA